MCCIWPSIPNRSKHLEYFYGCFHRPLALSTYSPLKSAKLNCSSEFTLVYMTVKVHFNSRKLGGKLGLQVSCLLGPAQMWELIMGLRATLIFSLDFLHSLKSWIPTLLVLCNPRLSKLYYLKKVNQNYRKVTSTSLSRLEAHAGFFRLSMKGKFYVYLLWTSEEKLISIL